MDRDQQQLRKYLLGVLPEDEAARLDELLFAEGEVLQRLQEEQEALTEDYVNGRLEAEEAAQFRDQCLRSPRLRRSVEEMQALVQGLQRKGAAGALSRAPRLRERILLVLSPTLAAALCVVTWMYVHERHVAKFPPTVAGQPIERVPEAVAPVTTGEQRRYVAFLAAGVVRGGGVTPQIAIPRAATTADLQVEVRDAGRPSGNWKAKLLQGDATVWQAARLPLRRAGPEQFLELHVDSAVLQPGVYTVEFAPSSQPKALQWRRFVVTPSR